MRSHGGSGEAMGTKPLSWWPPQRPNDRAWLGWTSLVEHNAHFISH